jgi:TolB-like protein
MAAAALALALAATPTAARAGPGTLAILYFDNQGNDDLEPLKVGLAQMLITDIKTTSTVTVVERARLQEILDELELGHSGVVDPGTAAQVGKLLGAEWLLLGSYFELLGTLRVDARLVRVETGEIIHADGVHGATASFMGMEQQLATSLRDALAGLGADASPGIPAVDGPRGVADAGVGSGDETDGDASSSTVRSSDPGAGGVAVESSGAGDPSSTGPASSVSDTAVIAPDPRALEAAVAFSEGLIYMDRDDVSRARESFQAALEANPNLEEARDALAAIEI